MQRITISSRMSLTDLERSFAAVPDKVEVEINLPTKFGPAFFVENRVHALLAHRVRFTGESTKIRYRGNVGLEDARLDYLGCMFYPDQGGFGKSEKIDRRVAIGDILVRNGVVEHEGLGKSQTICSFDMGDGQSIEAPILSGLGVRGAWIKRFLEIRRQFFLVGSSQNYEFTADLYEDQHLAKFVYEIYQNAMQHGRLDRTGQVLSGLRYLRIRKHISTSSSEILSRADGFPELQTYLSALIKKRRRPVKLLEISVGDQGLGIVARYCAASDQELPKPSDETSLINRIIAQSLSSKVIQQGAGQGLTRALTAVAQLGGFLSLRTGRSWLVYSGAEPFSKSLSAVHEEGIESVAGAHYSLLVPID